MPLVLLLGISLCFRPAAAGEIPRWEQVLNEVLERVQQERQRPAPVSSESPPPRQQRPLPEAVAQYVRHFQREGERGFRASVARLQPLRPIIARIFREEGLPPELVWIGLVESGFDPAARSPKNARGVWQLMPETAASFGLSTSGHDERTDVEKSTRAAARYLKLLYARFGDWPLALAAYNAGEQRVLGAMQRVGGRDFWRLAASDLLPKETRGYVPAVLAAQYLGEGKLAGDGASGHDDESGRAARVAVAPFSLSH